MDPRVATVPLANPLADDQAVLRSSLLPALYANLARQRAQKNLDVRVFELRSTFHARPEGLPHENRRVAALLSGRRDPPHWAEEDVDVDFFDAKGAVEAFVESFTGRAPIFIASKEPFLVAGAQAKVDLAGGYGSKTDVAGRGLGVVGEVHPDVLAAFGVKAARAFVFDLDFDALAKAAGTVAVHAELPRFPSAERDVALVVDDALEVGGMIAAVRALERKGLLEAVDVLDVFRGGKIPKGRKSVALSMVYRAADRTLTDDEVNGLHEKLVTGLTERFKAERRI